MPSSNRFAWTRYLGRNPGLDDPPPYAAAARQRDLTGLPPAWIGVGDLDLFHDDALDYADRLRRAGVAGALRVEPGTYHGADVDCTDSAPSMQRFRTAATAALRSALDPAVPASNQQE